MRTRHALGFAALVSTIGLTTSYGFADTDVNVNQAKASNAAQVTLVASGAKRGRIDGEERLRYPGFEQTTVVASKGHVVLITMEAVDERGRGPVQCSCSSYELRPDGPPREVASLKRLTDYSNGERTCNHPKAAADENGNIVWLYGSDGPVNGQNQNRPNTYAGILDEKCEVLASPQMVSIPRDANDGAPDVSYLGNGNFVAGYYSDGGGDEDGEGFPTPGGDYSVAMGLAVRPGALLPTLERTWIAPVVTPTNIGRPTVAALSADRAMFCAPKGPNRPSDSVECALLNTAGGAEITPEARVLVKTEFFKGGPGENGRGRKYFNQPTVVKVSDNQIALMAIESNGMGKGTNIKGSNVSHMMMIERNGDVLVPAGEIVGAAAHQTHASICVGNYGEQGAAAVGVFSAAPTGIGRASMAMVQYDNAAKAFNYDPNQDLWPAAWYGDSGHLSNWYGRNPMRQGRDYLRCIGGVENPGYHQPNGYMADVKSFFVAAVHGRIPGDEKNSLFLSLVPGQMDKKALPQNPVPAGETPDLEPDTSNDSGNGPKADSGCGCATPGTTGTTGTAALVGLAAAFGIVISRRRRNK